MVPKPQDGVSVFLSAYFFRMQRTVCISIYFRGRGF